jgi:hypothetical protein
MVLVFLKEICPYFVIIPKEKEIQIKENRIDAI